MNKEEKPIKTGVVTESLPATQFRVKLDEDNRIVLAYLSGKMRVHYIKILVGDKVKIEFSPYDNDKGRIVYRN